MKRGKLAQYAWSSDLMNIKVIHGEEEFSFNLNSEVVIDENRINAEIMDQPSAYAFLGLLHKKLIRVTLDKKREMEKTYSSKYIEYKGMTEESTGRPTANELAKEKAIASGTYQRSIKDYHRAKHEMEILETCVSSFEQRTSLIQTLSANIRKTN